MHRDPSELKESDRTQSMMSRETSLGMVSFGSGPMSPVNQTTGADRDSPPPQAIRSLQQARRVSIASIYGKKADGAGAEGDTDASSSGRGGARRVSIAAGPEDPRTPASAEVDMRRVSISNNVAYVLGSAPPSDGDDESEAKSDSFRSFRGESVLREQVC